MKLVTNTIVLAISLASIVTAAVPSRFYAQGLETKRPDSTCPTWRINYSVENEHGGYYLTEGYFEVDSCFDGDLSLGDGSFVLDIKRESNESGASVLTEYSSGVAVAGGLYANYMGNTGSGDIMNCWYGGGSISGEHLFWEQFCPEFV